MAKTNTPQIITMVSIFAVLIGLIVFMRRNNGVEGYKKSSKAAKAEQKKAEAEAAKAKVAETQAKMQEMAKMFR